MHTNSSHLGDDFLETKYNRWTEWPSKFLGHNPVYKEMWYYTLWVPSFIATDFEKKYRRSTLGLWCFVSITNLLTPYRQYKQLLHSFCDSKKSSHTFIKKCYTTFCFFQWKLSFDNLSFKQIHFQIKSIIFLISLLFMVYELYYTSILLFFTVYYTFY